MKNQYNLPCNLAQTLNIIGDKWTLLILYQLKQGHDTYKDIQANLEGIPSNLLSERIKFLEEEGLISQSLYQNHPPRFSYTLTERGSDLSAVFNSIILWGEKHITSCHKKLVHVCGGKVRQQYYCPDCGKVVDDSELKVL